MVHEPSWKQDGKLSETEPTTQVSHLDLPRYRDDQELQTQAAGVSTAGSEMCKVESWNIELPMKSTDDRACLCSAQILILYLLPVGY